MPRLTMSLALGAPPKTKTYDIRDPSLPGFCVRVTPSGCRTWGLRYRTPDGASRRLSLGRVEDRGIDEARRLAKEKLGRVAAREDPQGQHRSVGKANTVKELCEWYLERYVVATGKTKHSVATDRSYIRCHVLASESLARKKVADVTRQDIEQVKIAMAKKPGAFRKVLAILRIMFRRAEEMGARSPGSDPCRGVKAARGKFVERYLTSDERARLERTFEDVLSIPEKREGHVSRGAVDALRFLALTGMRAGEVVDILCWGQIDWQHRQLRLPRSKTGAKIVHLSDAAFAFLRARHEKQPDDQRVFNGEQGGRVSIGRSWRSIRERAGLTDVRLHDLRHAFASDAIMGGVPLSQVGKLLGHRHHSTTERYAHISNEVLRNAANVVAARIEEATRRE
jgi:integrase